VTSARFYVGASYSHVFLNNSGLPSAVVGVGAFFWHENTTLSPPAGQSSVTKASVVTVGVGVGF